MSDHAVTVPVHAAGEGDLPSPLGSPSHSPGLGPGGASRSLRAIGTRALSNRRDVLAILAGGAALGGWLTLTRGHRAPVAPSPAPSPFRLRLYNPGSPPIDRATGDAIRANLRLSPGMSISTVLHWLRVFGDARTVDATGVAEVLDDLLDSGRLARRFGGPSSLVRSPYGARFLTTRTTAPAAEQRARFLHAYQVPAVLGELGVPSSRPLRVGGEVLTVADLVRDCLLNLQPREVTEFEPEWAAIALSLYLPPTRAWSNRWGEAMDFDVVGRFLVERDLRRFACQGTHLLHALAILLQADARFGLLSRGVARAAEELCRRVGRTWLAESQHSDGSWGLDWSGVPVEGSSERWHSVHVTGHLMECQVLLPPPLQAPRECLERAVRFLARSTADADRGEILREYCAYSHAGRVVLRWDRIDA